MTDTPTRGATLSDNKSVRTLTEVYCNPQMQKHVIDDKQAIVLHEIEELKKDD